MQAMGMPPIGNAGGSNTPGPSGIQSIVQPALGSSTTGVVPTNTLQQAQTQPTANTLTPGAPPASAIPTGIQQASTSELTNIFGQGIGGDIGSVIDNLGSNDSTYMQAYMNAMAQPNAENLATLNTTLGNSGVGANSSTAAIANADFQTGVTAQEGLQEQQLQQTDEQNLIGLLESTESAGNKQAGTSIWQTLGNVAQSVVGDIASIV
jgi:hypothetical protein